MGKAAEGQILATDAALARSRTRFETQELPPFTVKGKAKPVRAFALGVPDRRRLGQRDAPPLIGREHEMRALSDALESATRRRGRVVELVGEPGMGKSRMVEELISQTGSMTLLLARCELYENSSAYQPFRGLLRDVLGSGIDEDPIGAARRLRDRVEANAPHLLPWLPLLGIPMDIEMPMTPETEQLEVGFRRAPTRGRHRGATRVGAADAHPVRVRRRALDGRGFGRPARPDRREGRRPALADPGHPPRVRGRVQGPRRCRRPLAEPETARRRGRRALPRDVRRRTAAAGTRAHRAGGALGRQSAVPARARRRGRVGHARPGVARHGRRPDDRRDRPPRPVRPRAPAACSGPRCDLPAVRPGRDAGGRG